MYTDPLGSLCCKDWKTCQGKGFFIPPPVYSPFCKGGKGKGINFLDYTPPQGRVEVFPVPSTVVGRNKPLEGQHGKGYSAKDHQGKDCSHPLSGRGRAKFSWHVWNCWTCGSAEHTQDQCTVQMAPVDHDGTLSCKIHNKNREPSFLFWSESAGGYICIRCCTCDGS